MNNISFKFRLNMLITAAFAVGVLSGGMFAVRNYRRAISAETEASAQLVMGLLGSTQGLISSPTEAEEFRDRLIHEIPALTELRHVRLEVFDESGKSLIRSPLGAPDGGTRAPRWFTELVSPVPRSYQIPLSRGLGRSGIIVVTTDPHDEVAEEWTNTRDLMAVVGIFFLGLWILVLWYINFALRPIGELHSALEAFGHGESVRARVFGTPELARINRQFNDMADALESAGNENRTLNQRLIDLHDEERRAIARELHDNLAQYLFVIRTDAFAIDRIAESIAGQALGDAARSISDSAAKMESVIREMIRQLRPLVLDELGLQDALRDMVATWRTRNPRIMCNLLLDLPDACLSEAIELAVYHVVQESLTNVAKHSAASVASVTIRREGAGDISGNTHDQRLEVIVEDNGRGVSFGGSANGMGLVGMRERVETLGGKLETVYHADLGWRVTVRLPILPSRDADAA
ncbi:MAG TPA: histidine kinase [Candidatus Binataceae bacterium]|nr:histidine kinase [Candidatus Binataceae bacterium]